jgi:hypothetical protein
LYGVGWSRGCCGFTTARSGVKFFCFFFGNSQAAKIRNYLKKRKKEGTSFCEQKEAKKL